MIATHPLAEKELEDALRYYESCREGLGWRFAEEVYSAIARIRDYPDAWEILSGNTRRCLVNRFPYGIIFQIKGADLRIIAVANLHRRRNYWVARLDDE